MRSALLSLLFAYAATFGASPALGSTPAPRAPASAASTWLVLSDIHYNPFNRRSEPSPYGYDTNGPLLTSLFDELRRAVPNPPVIFIAGDFLAHGFPVKRAAATMSDLARHFDRAFPHAQFVIALGNNDSDCGDYEATVDGPFLRAVAQAWAPLVDRGGAAPNFARTFAHDGSYVASLPLPHTRAVVVDDVYDTVRYRNACGKGNPTGTTLSDLGRMLTAGPPNERNWLVMHVPPGIDAFSTAHLAHGLVVVPFMRPGSRERLTRLIGERRDRVALVIAGHTHRFSFRLSDVRDSPENVPILIAPSVSPIFHNAPAFLTLDILPSGSVANVTETSLLDGTWGPVDDLAAVGVREFDAAELGAFETRLSRDPALRARFARMYAGGAPPEITERNWRIYWCAATQLAAAEFNECTAAGGFSIFTGRGLTAVALLGVCALLLVTLAIRVRAARARPH
ncbi:MAG: metallophosphoesterase [Candidatus Eremiobacteraeota bacterium]|nr:metallophosphoesterase [Candidatus Eremiobacteraeota bacterium]